MSEEKKSIEEIIGEVTYCIRKEKCVLVLGPDLFYNCQKSIIKGFYEHLQSKGINYKFVEEEDLFSSSPKFENAFYRKFEYFFDALEPTEIYNKIAQIPFHLIVSTSPDVLLKKAYDNQKFKCNPLYYNKFLNPKDIEQIPDKEIPLIYNLLGYYEDWESLVLSFSDLFEFLSKILGEHKIKGTLQSQLRFGQTFLFLGFRFNSWYFRLLVRLLCLSEKAIQHASCTEVDNCGNNIAFYSDELNFEFMNISSMEIIDLLLKKFSEKNELHKPYKMDFKPSVINTINVLGDNNIIIQEADNSNLNINQKKDG